MNTSATRPRSRCEVVCLRVPGARGGGAARFHEHGPDAGDLLGSFRALPLRRREIRDGRVRLGGGDGASDVHEHGKRVFRGNHAARRLGRRPRARASVVGRPGDARPVGRRVAQRGVRDVRRGALGRAHRGARLDARIYERLASVVGVQRDAVRSREPLRHHRLPQGRVGSPHAARSHGGRRFLRGAARLRFRGVFRLRERDDRRLPAGVRGPLRWCRSSGSSTSGCTGKGSRSTRTTGRAPVRGRAQVVDLSIRQVQPDRVFVMPIDVRFSFASGDTRRSRFGTIGRSRSTASRSDAKWSTSSSIPTGGSSRAWRNEIWIPSLFRSTPTRSTRAPGSVSKWETPGAWRSMFTMSPARTSKRCSMDPAEPGTTR